MSNDRDRLQSAVYAMHRSALADDEAKRAAIRAELENRDRINLLRCWGGDQTTGGTND